MLNYNHDTAISRCFKAGLKWDAGSAASFDAEAKAAGLTQEQFDAMLWAYIWRMQFYWTPTNYGFGGRVCIAAYFVFQPVYAFVKRLFGRG
jgi:hypothetical protein